MAEPIRLNESTKVDSRRAVDSNAAYSAAPPASDERSTGPVASCIHTGHDVVSVVPSTETEANKANIRRYVDEALNRGILDVIDETRGELAEHAKEKVLAWRNAFPDFHTTIETLVAEDDWVAYNVRHQGTHQGEFEGVAPTDKHVEFRTMVFNRFADGIVVENWGLHDHASVLERLRAD